MELDKLRNSGRLAIQMISMLKFFFGVKNYYAGMGAAMSMSLMIGLIINSWFFKFFFIINAIGLFLVIIYDE